MVPTADDETEGTGTTAADTTTTRASADSPTSANADDTGEDSTSSTTTADSSTGPSATDTGVDTSSSTDSSSSDESTDGVESDPDLIGWYRLDAVAPPTILDSSQYAHDGMCRAGTCPTPAAGVVDGAARFDAAQSQVVLIDHNDDHNTTEALTLAVWVQVEGATPETTVVFSKPFGTGIGNSWQLNITSSLHPQVNFRSDFGQTLVTLDDPIPAMQWVHYALTWDGATVSVWIDGALQEVFVADSIQIDASPILIGADIDNLFTSNYLPGLVDDARIYRRALEADEIADLADSKEP